MQFHISFSVKLNHRNGTVEMQQSMIGFWNVLISMAWCWWVSGYTAVSRCYL